MISLSIHALHTLSSFYPLCVHWTSFYPLGMHTVAFYPVMYTSCLSIQLCVLTVLSIQLCALVAFLSNYAHSCLSIHVANDKTVHA